MDTQFLDNNQQVYLRILILCKLLKIRRDIKKKETFPNTVYKPGVNLILKSEERSVERIMCVAITKE